MASQSSINNRIPNANFTIDAGNLLLPTTSSTVGQIQVNTVRAFHKYGTANNFVGGNAGNFTLTVGSATNNNGFGDTSLASLTTGNTNCCVGSASGNKLTTGSNNVAVGHAALWNGTGSTQNVAIGQTALQDASVGNQNVAVGYNALGAQPLSYNIAIGAGAGFSYGSTTESSNIVIGNSGVNGENNVIRLGTTGTGNGQQNLCYIAGAVTFGNSTATETHALANGAGVKTVTLGSTNTTSATTVQSGSGALNITATNGALTINSGTGALGISTDASATTVSFATGGAVKTVTLGSTNSTSTTTVQSGTGGVSITTAANANITLSPGGAGTVSVTAAPIVPTTDRADSLGSTTNSWDNVYCDGVSFDDGTNLLSTFVDSTSWTPVLAFGGGSTGITYSTQVGRYTRIGNLAFLTCKITLTNKGSSTGAAQITGFPLTAIATSGEVALAVRFGVITFADQMVARIGAGGSTINLEQAPTGSALTVLTDTAFANTSTVTISGCCIVS